MEISNFLLGLGILLVVLGVGDETPRRRELGIAKMLIGGILIMVSIFAMLRGN